MKIINLLVVLPSLICLMLTASCDKRLDYLTENNDVPKGNLSIENEYAAFTANVNGNVVTDSCKTGNYYRFKVIIQDESEYSETSFEGDGTLVMNGTVLTSGTFLNGEHYFEWIDTVPGSKSFNVKFTDPLGAEEVYTFFITVFDNLPPTISWVVEDINTLSPLHKRIVVSGEDGDKFYGGEISYYRFVINGDTTNFPNSTMDYIFPAAGNYGIGVIAIDNNGAASNNVFVNNYPIQ